MKRTIVITIVVVAAGCGGGGKSGGPSNTADPGAGTGTDTAAASGQGVYGGAEYGGYKRTPELTAFHDLIADKMTAKDACPISAELNTAAAAIKAAPVPVSDAEGVWAGEANELAGIAEDFVTNCAGSDTEMMEHDVVSMHRSFQRLLIGLRTR